MIISQSQIHHRPRYNNSINNHRPHLCSMHTKNSTLRGVDDGSAHEGTEDATVGDCEGAAGHVFEGHLTVAGFLTVHGDGLFDVGKAVEVEG